MALCPRFHAMCRLLASQNISKCRANAQELDIREHSLRLDTTSAPMLALKARVRAVTAFIERM
jgi:hypothetical protein